MRKELPSGNMGLSAMNCSFINDEFLLVGVDFCRIYTMKIADFIVHSRHKPVRLSCIHDKNG